MLLNDGPALAAGGFFQGYTAAVWVIILIAAFGGILIAIVVKYTDNIAKGFATSISIIVSSVVSAVFFHFDVTTVFVTGASIVILSVLLYSDPDKSLAAGVQPPSGAATAVASNTGSAAGEKGAGASDSELSISVAGSAGGSNAAGGGSVSSSQAGQGMGAMSAPLGALTSPGLGGAGTGRTQLVGLSGVGGLPINMISPLPSAPHSQRGSRDGRS